MDKIEKEKKEKKYRTLNDKVLLFLKNILQSVTVIFFL